MSDSSDVQSSQDELERGPSCPPSLYCILAVPIAASQGVIKNAYRRLARLYHPDRNMGDEFATRKFQQVVAAYEVLSENESRQAYDLNLLDQLDVEDYLSRFQGLILTVCGLGMTSTSPPDSSDSMGSKCNSYMQLSAA